MPHTVGHFRESYTDLSTISYVAAMTDKLEPSALGKPIAGAKISEMLI